VNEKLVSSLVLSLFVQVWGIEEMVYYAESMAKKIPLPKPSQYVHDDPQQVNIPRPSAGKYSTTPSR
jgi:hypothetical protein